MTNTILADIPLDQLHDSPFQPRTHYAGLEGLAESIRADGLQQPLRVRPLRPDPPRDDITDGYELVFGHRRKRAAELAGLATVPCLVTAMTDAEVRAAQMAENVQRENMRAIEEAQGYQVQIQADGISQAELARRIGKSPSHVAGRLRLLQLTPSVRQALDDGRIGAEVALLIARVGPPVVQDKALAAIAAAHLSSDLEDGGKRSLRDVRNLLAEKFTLDLKGALFDAEDTTLVWGAGACSACPKRSGNAPEFADVAQHSNRRDQDIRQWDYLCKAGPDICTDPDCFSAKQRTHLQRQAEQLRAEGKTVIDGNKARQAIDAQGNVKGDFVPAAAVKAELAKVRKDIIKRGQLPPAPVTIQDPRNGKTVQAYPRADLERAGVNLTSADPKHVQRGFDWEAERRQEREACDAEHQARRRLLLATRQAMRGTPWTQDDLLMVVRHALDECDPLQLELLAELWGAANSATLADTLDAMPHADLAQLLLDAALTDRVTVASRWQIEYQPEALLDAAARYGVDVDAARAEPVASAAAPPPAEPATDPAPTPSTAARAAKKGAATKSKGKAQGRAAARGVRYRCPDTGSTWSGRGLQPVWVKAALASGRTLAELAVKGKDQTDKARSAGRGQTDDAGSAGEAERDTRTADLFEGSAP